jgi:hypothetical protein
MGARVTVGDAPGGGWRLRVEVPGSPRRTDVVPTPAISRPDGNLQ